MVEQKAFNLKVMGSSPIAPTIKKESMTSENDLYTDYALQLFSTYLSGDVTTMHSVLESFKQDNKNIDSLFMPGVIYGLMYHLGMIIGKISEEIDVSAEEMLAAYAMDYAVIREDLIDNPLLNVAKARENFESFVEELKKIEEFEEWFSSEDE